MVKRILQLLAIGSLAWGPLAFADTSPPTVTSFTINPPSIQNDLTTTLTWNVIDGDGHDLYFNCPEGVTLKVGASMFECNSRHAVSGNASDSVGFTVDNVSGAARSVQVTVYPKIGGIDNDAGAMSQTFTVGTAIQPITDFSTSKTTAESGESVTFTWTGVYAVGTNLQIDCVNGLAIYSGSSVSGTPLQCGTSAFSNDLAVSGSATLTFVNTTQSQVGAIVHVMPAIRSGLYDSTHGRAISVAINPQVVSSTHNVLNPTVLTVTPSVSNIISGVPFTLAWTSKDASSSNIQYACNDSVTLFASTDATSTLVCGSPAFATAFSQTATTTLVAITRSAFPQNITLTVLPRDTSGVYQLAGSKTISLAVSYQAPIPGSTQTQTTPAATINSTTGATSTPAVVSKAPSHIPFVRTLSRGSKNSDVVALQLFLGLNPQIYPENSATGIYGPATQRAVQRFQEKYGLAKKGDQGFGSVGPKTRAKLNSLTLP